MIIISNRQDKVDLDGTTQAVIRRAVREALTAEGIWTGAEVGVTLVDDITIAQYNLKYRGRDEATDVLAFPMADDEPSGPSPWLALPPLPPMAMPPLLLGDIVISAEYGQRQADEFGVSLNEEIARLVIHGFLHLLGYEHEQVQERQVMESREAELARILGLTMQLKE